MKKIVSFLLILLLFFGCTKEEPEFELTTIKYIELGEFLSCFNCFNIGNLDWETGFVINDEETYRHYEDSIRIDPYNTNCDTATLMDIDFSLYSLVGIITPCGMCDSITRSFSIDNENETILYTVFINRFPCNYALYLPLNLAMVNKIPDNFEVDYCVITHQEKYY